VRARPRAGRAPAAADKPTATPSLRARAVALLARREHTRVELARKLAPHAGSRAELDQLLDELLGAKLQSDERYAEARTHALASRYGAARIAHELRAKGVAAPLVARVVAGARSSELERARAVWRKRFDALPADPLERVRQMRFLAARGFASDIIRRIVGGDAIDE
jgi:regulatory protein